MRPVSRTISSAARLVSLAALAAAALLAALPGSLGAQPTTSDYGADFPTVRAQFLDRETRQAAFTLSEASGFVRQQVGRAFDADCGMRLMGAEERLDRLVARLRTGAVGSVATLDSAFASTDRLLAEHHWRLAARAWAVPRLSTPRVLGAELDATAFTYARALGWEGRTPDGEAAAVLADARRVAATLAAATTTDLRAAAPRETGAVIDALGRLVAPPPAAVVAQAR